MVITIEENVLIAVVGVIFIPLFLFLFRMVIKVNQLENRLDALVATRVKADVYIEQLVKHDSDLQLLNMRIDNLEKAINKYNNKDDKR